MKLTCVAIPSDPEEKAFEYRWWVTGLRFDFAGSRLQLPQG
jgi:hypothetical protein